MKRFHYSFILLSLIGILFSSCYKDKGNYDLRPMDQLSTKGPEFNQDNFVFSQLDSLKINPEVTFTGDSTHLEFSWKLIPQQARVGDTTIKKISSLKNLLYVVRVPIGLYTVLLEVKDVKTDIIRSRTYGLNVKAKASQGFLVLNDKEGGVQDIDVILDNTKPEVFWGAFSANNTISLREATGMSMIQSAANPSGLLYIFRKSGGYTLLPSFGFLQDVKAWFFDAQSTYAPTLIYQDFFGANNYMINNGSVHTTTLITPPLLFGYRASGDYKATKSLIMSANVFVYDDLHHRFLKFNKSAGKMQSIIKNPADAFDVEDIGNKSCLLFDHNMASTVSPGAANFNSLKPLAYCKDNQTGKTFVYKFGFYKSLASYCESVKEVTAPGFSMATAYVNASNNPLTYYASENKIYAYDFTNDVARVVYTFDQTNVSIDQLMTNGTQFFAVVNSKSGNSGAVFFFKIDPTGSFNGGTYFSKYEKFGKIREVKYKYNTLNPAIPWK
ncbi:PKD-like family lipoprotein [Pedobacter caeni]|uniref:PKD-like family protein n=1 Tax=Pedobacter caeni TaxID=288992 RepID=A0A1M5LJ72_9SPHI|nr:PKD-like family lipoprotein [Pedobacter caeni]SHG64413.1 PKD-like family protein [Pedobacter caeni]